MLLVTDSFPCWRRQDQTPSFVLSQAPWWDLSKKQVPCLGLLQWWPEFSLGRVKIKKKKYKYLSYKVKLAVGVRPWGRGDWPVASGMSLFPFPYLSSGPRRVCWWEHSEIRDYRKPPTLTRLSNGRTWLAVVVGTQAWQSALPLTGLGLNKPF